MSEPYVLFAEGRCEPDLLYAAGILLNEGVYLKFGDGDDVLAVPTMEVERARTEGRAARVVDRIEAGWREQPERVVAWAPAIASLARERGVARLRAPARLPAALCDAVRADGLEVEIDHELLVAERRRKSKEEQSWIHAAQRAAEAACLEVIRRLAAAEVRDDFLWEGGRPLTSEHLVAAASATLEEVGYESTEMIVAGSPGCALPHYRGEGQLRAHQPVIIDIFPRGRHSGYHGDLTRTVIAGEVGDKWRRVNEAVLSAFDAGARELRAGANGRTAHLAACRALVEAGFGTSTPGFEGSAAAPHLTHSLGHGVGLALHEPPFVRDLDYELQAGDVHTVEPGLYEVGAGGIRWEDTGVVEDGGFRNFSSLPKSLDPQAYL